MDYIVEHPAPGGGTKDEGASDLQSAREIARAFTRPGLAWGDGDGKVATIFERTGEGEETVFRPVAHYKDGEPMQGFQEGGVVGGDDKGEILSHLVADHGWGERDASAHASMTYDEIEETHDQEHANDLDPHRFGTKDLQEGGVVEGEQGFDAVSIAYLPANQAWMVLWHDQRLAGPFNDKSEAEEYVSDLRKAIAADRVITQDAAELEGMQEGSVVENVGPGVPAVVGEAGPEAVIPLDDPEAVEVMAEAIEEGGAALGQANANDATIAAAEAVESAAEAVEVVAASAAVADVADSQEEAVEDVAEAAEEIAESKAEVAEEAIEATEDEQPQPIHGFFVG